MSEQIVYSLWYEDEVTPDNSGIMAEHVYTSEFAAMKALEKYAKEEMNWMSTVYQSPSKYTFRTSSDFTVDVYIVPLKVRV